HPAARRIRERDSSVRRIDDEGRALVPGQLVAALVPELVVRQHAALGTRQIAGAWLALFGIAQIPVEPCVLCRCERGCLFVGERCFSLERIRPLEGRDRAERIDACEVWLSIWSSSWSRSATLRRRMQRRQRDRRQQRESPGQ